MLADVNQIGLEAAANALKTAAERNEAWGEQDKEWDS